MPLFGSPRPGFFYPSLVYNAVTINFDDPVTAIEVQRKPIRGRNLSQNGTSETLFFRVETMVVLSFRFLQKPKLEEIRTYIEAWGLLGKQAVLTLDRLSTCAGQYEYDAYNAFFTKAELLNDPFAPTRSLMPRALYSIQLAFRQGP